VTGTEDIYKAQELEKHRNEAAGLREVDMHNFKTTILRRDGS
jgi:hypothetical protein